MEEMHYAERSAAVSTRIGQAADKKAWESYMKQLPFGTINIPSYIEEKKKNKVKPKVLSNDEVRLLQKQLRGK